MASERTKVKTDKEKEKFEGEIKEMFKLFDKNGDNNISTAEMGKVLRTMGFQMTNKEIKAAVKQIDTNGNGTIEYGEFRSFLIKQFKHSKSEQDTRQEIRQAFRIFDRDGNGYIEKAELRRAMKTMGEPLTETELDIMMRDADKNKDGKIDYEEFVVLWTSKTKDLKEQSEKMSK
ncbi:calmodulin-beta-like [Mercenaria mercenaria]|uniref:calmodulin-beta-like n=1 Tax=Mercenaria mercenaria TaxID=6596 RepID=UPI00234ED870|nr:calmodulin-beta-like [Mercenaria mercenaria]